MAIDSINLSSLPTRLRAYVEEIIDTTDADPVMVVMSVLSMASAFVKKTCYIPESGNGSVEGGYFQKLYPNLWVVCISPSGSFKTTALNKGFKLAYEHDLSSKNLNTQQQGNNGNILLPNRVTTEALIQDLSEGSGGAIVCSELGEWLEMLEKTYNQGLKPLLTDLYDVPKRYRYRTKGAGSIDLYEPFITICGMSTFEWIKKNVTKDDVTSGFFARFLLFSPPHTNKIPPALPTNKQNLSGGMDTEIRSILKNIQGPKAYYLSPESQDEFIQYHDALYKRINSYNESAKSFLNPYLKRWSPYVLKIAMLMQLFIDETKSEVSLEALRGAVSIVDYAVRSTTWLFENELGESDIQRKQRKVLEFLQKKGGYIIRRKLLQAKLLDGGFKELDYVLENLEQMGKIRTDNRQSLSEMGIYLQEEEEWNR